MSSPVRAARGDEAARRRALDTACSFLVQAPAGSGKTELLIQRYLALLAEVPVPEAIVAITFTRKAAGEMQERILATLRRAEKRQIPEKAHELVSYNLALAALAHDRRQDWRLLEHPSRLRIQTIDSLCASITRQMPWLARFGAQPAVAEDARALYAEPARRTVAEIEKEGSFRQSLECVLLHLDNNVPTVCGLIERMLQIRDQWLEMVVSGCDSRGELERGLGNAIRDGLECADTLVPAEAKPTLVQLARYAAGNVPAGHPMAACAALAAWPGTEPAALPIWRAMVGMLLTGSGGWRKQATVNDGFPRGCDGPKDQRNALVTLFSENTALRESLDFIRVLPPARYTDSQWQVIQALFDVLKLAAGHLKLVFRERGEVDFCEVAQAARQALGDMDAPSDLALGLDARIQHLLVDEFQDTSVAQKELLLRLMAGWQPGDGRTLFLVGDPMQSIYRFRQAEVGLFLSTAAGGAGETSLDFLRLRINHRSVGGIVDRVNEIFAHIFPVRDDIATGAITYSACEAGKSAATGDALTVHAFRKGEDAAEAKLVASLVRGSEGTVAVLVRARTHLPEIVAALKGENIPFRAVDIDRLSERTVVQDLLALTRAMLHLADRPSWLAILRAPWCGLSLGDLHALVQGRPRATVWELLAEPLERLSPEGRERTARLHRILTSAFAERGRWPLRRWVERVWCALGGPACLPNDDYLRDAGDFFDLLEGHQQAGDLPEFDGFRHAVEELYAQPDASADGRVQLMTIHKAKGLQFDNVIVPGLGRGARHDSLPLLLYAERPRGNDVDHLLAPIKEAGTDNDPVYAYLQAIEKQKSAHECVRLLYVAATRARRRLHLLGHAVMNAKGEVGPEGGSLLARLWPGLRPEERAMFTGCYGEAPPLAEQAASSPGVPLRRLPLSWSAPELPATVVWNAKTPGIAAAPGPTYLWVGDALRHVGTVVHAALERMAGQSPDPAAVRGRRSVYRSALAGLGVPPAELEHTAKRVEEALLRVLESPRGRWILAPHCEAACESSRTGVLDGELVRGTVDRTFVDENGVRWVIDYKTSSHEGGGLEQFLDEELRRYRDQLERYARLWAPLGRPVRLALYFPLLDGWREWAPPTGP